MQSKFSYQIINDPEPEDAGTIILTAEIVREDDDNSTFTTVSLAKDFLDDVNDECKSKEDLNYFLLEAGINADIIDAALVELFDLVDELTCPESNEYSPGCVLKVGLELVPDHYVDDDDDSQIQEALQASLNDTSNIRFRPASKLVVKSLPRKIYNKKMNSLKDCRICLEEFSNGGTIVPLSCGCGHEFDEECILRWFETSHVCPLCRFELPCEDEH